MQPQNTHLGSLETSTAITRYYLPQAIAPLDVIAVLNNSCINFVLVGTHALGGWMRKPRATVDTDIITIFVADTIDQFAWIPRAWDFPVRKVVRPGMIVEFLGIRLPPRFQHHNFGAALG